ncbi:hypothetical protein HZA99_05950 [Candidatus Woesearchaeota archaeon]|nr:hypothetical protein [Candidatus Woesearchaeota archaeon]
MASKKTKNMLFWVGIAVVVLSHVYMLVAGLPASMMTGHALLNIVAAGFIVFGVRG